MQSSKVIKKAMSILKVESRIEKIKGWPPLSVTEVWWGFLIQL